jgi:hypothetical protein
MIKSTPNFLNFLLLLGGGSGLGCIAAGVRAEDEEGGDAYDDDADDDEHQQRIREIGSLFRW